MILKISVLFLTLHYAAWEVVAQVVLDMEDVVEVYKGNSAVIHCNYNFTRVPSVVMVQWFVRTPEGRRVRISYSDLTVQKVDENTMYSDRIAVAGHGSGENLTVADVRLSDEREFICQVNGLASGNGENRTHLKVFDPPEEPVIEAVQSGVSVKNTLPSKIATCEVREAFPKPNITWYRNNKALHPEKGRVNVVTLVTVDASGLYAVQSELQYKVEREDQESLFFCELHYQVPGAVRTARSRSINVTVHYPTANVKMWRDPPEGLVKEGDTVEIGCQGDGNPPPSVVFVREQAGRQEAELKSDRGVLLLKEVTRGNSGVYKCRPLDSNAAASEDVAGSMQLTVHYLDPAVVVPKDSEVMLKGETLTATCNALSSLETSAVWLKGGKVVGTGHTLQLRDATFATAGHYNCEVTVPSLPDLHTRGSVHIIVQGSPELQDAEDVTEMVKVGKWKNLTCEAKGHPKPVITWSVAGSPSWREVIKRELEDSVQSVVTLKVTTDTLVTCNATNNMGLETKTYTIKHIPITPAVPHSSTGDGSGVSIVIIIVCILLLAIMGSVFYFLHKKGKLPCGRSGKQEITKEKTNKDDIVVEMKAEKTEKSGLLKCVNGEKKPPSDQYIDLRN
ncbi:cell surface glycoprotein MUC18 isoform X1 [Brachyhypopomus gauderio]|uniref:cell surface glycoprotein MUC18 isoform X1 n=1 Tax=Brachyhypopomus gauderio TaxID=698409 RepID=UPI004042EB2A